MRFVWCGVLISSVLGGVYTLAGLATAASAPQQAATAAIGMAMAVIPYCFARACAEPQEPSEQLKLIAESLAVQTKLLAQIANDSASRETVSQ